MTGGCRVSSLGQSPRNGSGRSHEAHQQRASGVESMRDQTGDKNPNWRGGIARSREALRKNKAAYRARHRERHLAHKAVQTAVARGKLVRGNCEVCGAASAHAHHEDYSRPLDVRWFCKTHHEQSHKPE